MARVAVELPDSSEETNSMVLSIAKIVGAIGLIAAVAYFSPIGPAELFNWFLFVLLPILLVLAALRVVSTETISIVWNQELSKRVRAKVGEMRGWGDAKVEYVSA